MDKVDFLIVGQGIAGTMLAYKLIKSGKTVCVVDNGKPSASTVAAGLFNPVTGRRFVKSWLIDELLPCAETNYYDLEELLGQKFYFKKPIVRILAGHEEKMVYDRALTEENKKYIEGFYDSGSDNQYAYCEIKHGGYVDLGKLILSFRKYLLEKDFFRLEEFDYQDLIISGNKVTWKGISAHGVIFCEGYQATKNPYFPGLAFNLAKGEILTLKIPGLGENKILMSGVYLVPLGNEYFKLGSTYEWVDLEPVPTSKGRAELLEKLKAITELPFEVKNHEAGIRPTTKNRRPFVGKHPEIDNLFIMNGMGTKGVLLAPYFATQLCDYLINGNTISKEADVLQYY